MAECNGRLNGAVVQFRRQDLWCGSGGGLYGAIQGGGGGGGSSYIL